MQTFQKNIIKLLADGRFHSGEILGERLGMTRSAVCKHIKSLANLGIDVHRVQGKGYCIPNGIDFLSEEKIRAVMQPLHASKIASFEIFDTLPSTNLYLLDKIKFDSPLRVTGISPAICFAEYQSAGRGRRGRDWVSPYGKNIYLSLLWCFQNGSAALSGLALAVGLAVVDSLKVLGVTDLGLKWPNDIFYKDAKLAGILVESFVDSLGFCHVVIGIGLNLDISDLSASQIDQPWVDLNQILPENLDRNHLSALLLDQLFMTLALFEDHGFKYFSKRWSSFDILSEKKVEVDCSDQSFCGIVRGVDEQGGLLLECDGSLRTIHSGELRFS